MWDLVIRDAVVRDMSGLDDKDLVHLRGENDVLTYLGEPDVEARKLLEPL